MRPSSAQPPPAALLPYRGRPRGSHSPTWLPLELPRQPAKREKPPLIKGRQGFSLQIQKHSRQKERHGQGPEIQRLRPEVPVTARKGAGTAFVPDRARLKQTSGDEAVPAPLRLC